MTNQIVTINVTQNVGATPSTLQRTGALISVGGTTTASGTRTLLTQLADLTPILAGALPITSITWLSSVATVTTAAPHGFTISDVIPLTIAGAVPAGYNGAVNVTITGASTFTYPLVSNPGSETTPGTYIVTDESELVQMATTFFAQGSSIGVYVLELGASDPDDGIAALSTYITNNPGFFYGYLVPRSWDNNANLLTLLASYENTTAKVYFWITTTSGTYNNYPPTMKDAITMVEAPTGRFTTEFSLASAFRVALNYNPSSTNKVTPLAFAFLFGVTPYPTVGTAALRQSFKTAGVNIVATGSEGGITNDILLWGSNMDVRPFNYWYSVDWAQINLQLNLANAIINGSNNPINPLYLNQDGINRLQVVAAATMNSAVVVGLALGTVVQTELNGPDFDVALNAGKFAGQVVVNAVPFVDYYTANPGDYKIGVYNGFSVTYVPLRGFESITVNLNVSDFVTA